MSSVDAAVYYQPGYWNDFPQVSAEINRRISGDPARGFVEFFGDIVGRRRFGRALFLNCGNGWVERRLFEAGVFDRAIGIDSSKELLDRARAAAAGLPLHYLCADVNAAVLPHERYDLVVNHAAGHHVTYIDRVFRALCRSLVPGGVMLNYDYVGPHRNQYPYEQWEPVWRLNQTLPLHARQQLSYPHLPTMLTTDRSEAVHSELILETFRRYFSIESYRPTGGALAYPLLTFNAALQSLSPDDAAPIIERIIHEDGRYLNAHPTSSLFAFWIGRPLERILLEDDLLARWESDEIEREVAAERAGGRYYAPSLLEALMYAPDGTGAAR